MSKIKVKGHDSGTGVITIEAPNTSTDRTIVLPDESVTLGAATPSIDDNGDATAITIDSSENVGIGTASPTAKVEINRDGAALGTGWASNTGLAVVAADAYLDIVSDDGGSAGSAIAFKQVDGTTFENAWNIGRKTNGDGTGDGSLNFAYGTNAGQQQNTTLLSMTTDGRGLSQFTAKAWVAWNQTGTIAIRDSHNVSSMSDYGTGEAKINLTNNMATADSYAVSALASKASGAPSGSNSTFTTIGESSPVTGPIIGMIYNGSASDRPYASAIIFGD